MGTDADYDSNSLKRRNPRQMFTDSAFYSPKHHPSVADQVEMAHQLSSSLYNEGNKMSKGQEMYLKRAKTSGDTSDIEASLQQPGDKPLNLKLVLNPAGKVHDWTDLPEEEIPELQQIATGGLNPEAARQMVENLQACKGKGGELFAKRRKKADKWVVDEGTLKSNPSQLADQFFVQQQDFQQQDYQERTEVNHSQKAATEVDSGAAEERQRMQQEFEKQQLLKQQQGFEMRQQQQNNAMPGGPANVEDLPPNFQHCSLKGRPFTPTMDLSIHNTQGIDVWVTKGPRPFGSSGTLPRTAIKKAAKSGELPPQPAKPQQQQQAPAPAPAALAVPQVAICPATPAVNEQELIVSSQKQTSSSTVMSSSSSSTTVQQQGGVNSVQTSSVQEVATHTQSVQNNDEVDRAKKAAEEQQRLEQEKRNRNETRTTTHGTITARTRIERATNERTTTKRARTNGTATQRTRTTRTRSSRTTTKRARAIRRGTASTTTIRATKARTRSTRAATPGTTDERTANARRTTEKRARIERTANARTTDARTTNERTTDERATNERTTNER